MPYLKWIATLIAGVCLMAGAEEESPSLIKETYTDAQGGKMPWQLRFPANYDPEKSYPLALCLHGAGGRGDDNAGRGTEAGKVLRAAKTQKSYPCFVLQPQCPKGNKWADVDWQKGSYDFPATPISDQMTQALAILRQVLEAYPVDRTRIYVSGQSMGGFGTWDIIMRQPDLFAAAVPVCGSADPSQAPRLAHLPIWTFHGEVDPTIPVQSTRDMVEALNKAGCPVRYTEYPNVAHGSWGPAWKEADLLPWLFAQQRKASGVFAE